MYKAMWFFCFRINRNTWLFLRNGGYYGNKQDGDKGHFSAFDEHVSADGIVHAGAVSLKHY